MEKLGSPDLRPPLMGAVPNAAKKAEAEGGETVVAGGNSELFRCACMRRWLPLAYREELYHVLRLTGPLVSDRWSSTTAKHPVHTFVLLEHFRR